MQLIKPILKTHRYFGAARRQFKDRTGGAQIEVGQGAGKPFVVVPGIRAVVLRIRDRVGERIEDTVLNQLRSGSE